MLLSTTQVSRLVADGNILVMKQGIPVDVKLIRNRGSFYLMFQKLNMIDAEFINHPAQELQDGGT